VSDQRHGLAFGIAAYGLWGAFPLFWTLLEPAGAVEILAHRMVWSALTMTLVVVLARRTGHLRRIIADPRSRWLLLLASGVISLNWVTFIWGVNNGHVVEVSLGYFVNPLVTVLMAVLILGERMRPVQWGAMGVAAAAVVVLTVDHGRLPWIALVLACSFGTYGLAKKQAGAGALESLCFETWVVAPFALAYVGWLVATGSSTFETQGLGHAALMVTTGVVTALPLVCFGAAATRLPLVTLGLLQYLAPAMHFLLGVLVFQEHMSGGRWVGFALVWIALTVFTTESIGHRRRQLRLAAEASAV